MGNSKPRLRASCDGCFLAKVKCSKARPVCSRCLIVGLVCKYSPSGVTRSAARAAPDALCPATLSEESFAELGAWNRSPLADQQQQLSPGIPMSAGGVGPASVGTAAPSPYSSASGPPPPPAHKYGVAGAYSQGPSPYSSPASAAAPKSGAAPWFSTGIYSSSSSAGGLEPASMYPQQPIATAPWTSAYNTTTESTAWSPPVMSPVDGGLYDLATQWPQDDPSSAGVDPYAYQSGSFSAMQPYQASMTGYDANAAMSQYTAAGNRWQ
jgi:hypothetical protein